MIVMFLLWKLHILIILSNIAHCKFNLCRCNDYKEGLCVLIIHELCAWFWLLSAHNLLRPLNLIWWMWIGRAWMRWELILYLTVQRTLRLCDVCKANFYLFFVMYLYWKTISVTLMLAITRYDQIIETCCVHFYIKDFSLRTWLSVLHLGWSFHGLFYEMGIKRFHIYEFCNSQYSLNRWMTKVFLCRSI